MKKKILYTFAVLFALLLITFLALKNGLFISSIQFDFLKLEQLYIKLDKKLILRAKNITIKTDESSRNEANFGSKEFLDIVKNLKYFYAFFEEVDIQSFNVKDNQARLLFKNNEFFMDNDLLFVKLSLFEQNKNINAEIKKVLFKDYNLSIVGNLSINTKSEFYNFNGIARSDFIDFNVSISYKNKNLAYKIEDVNIKDFIGIMSKIKRKVVLPKSVDLWITHNAVGGFYHFDFIQGFIDFARNNYYFDNISAFGYVNNVKVRLDNYMNAIEFPRLDLNLSNQKLDFQFQKASYNGADLSQSKVYLFDLFDEKKIGIYLRIKSDNLKFDQKLARALQNYHFKLPFYQTSGNLKGDLELKVYFHEKGQVIHNGIFFLEDANLSLENTNLSLFDFNISKALIRLNQNDLNIENANIKNDFLQANFNAKIDLQNHKGVFDTQISRFYFDDGKLLDMKNQNIIINLDYSQNLQLDIPNWNSTLNFKDKIEVNLNNPNVFITHSPILKKFGFLDAKNIYFNGENFQNFNLQAQDISFDGNLLTKDQVPYRDSLSIMKQKDTININTQSDLISAVITPLKKEIQVKNLTYIYKKDTNSSDSIFDINKNKQNIVFGGANFSLVLGDLNKTLAFDKIEVKLNENVLSARGSRGNTNLSFYYSPNDLKFFAKNIDDQYLNEFLQKQAVQDGIFNLSIVGSGVDYFDGEFDFKNTFIKDLKGINQLISFIDTVPSLLMFKTPTFNQKGLNFQDGRIIFNRKKDLLSFSAIKINGDSVDIYGLGSANLRLYTIDLDLELRTLKSASETISKVPILNYVILGKNQQISTNIKVDGTLDNPSFHTQILSDTLKTPFNLIKNIIQLPANLFN
ncbi:YhdP family protein [Campylobacter estrildidarum]|uniref:YhdP central domain-containing protein n=1 Tax=Campylobacter estrildidarum TaxID=2510189 RepID=A0A4U7BSS7_9BACT|nr:AsmA-like C-terminal domain-containing protein [Campylobacter estrildidarum]TKX32136.1 hypothetical protein CQA69_01095 [Campylobacter estrildidarum]